jgi:hypothetical protein
MLKKVAYFYLITALGTLLLFVLGIVINLVNEDYALLVGFLAYFPFVFLVFTTPIWLTVPVLILAKGSLQSFFTQAESFHRGNNPDFNNGYTDSQLKRHIWHPDS